MEQSMQGKKILLVEDDAFINDIYQTKLKESGFEVIVSEDGLNALKKMEDGLTPDLILLDVMMPYLDGMEFLKKIRAKEEWKAIPVILLTNLFHKENIDEGMDLGANDYLIKSHFTPSEVLEKVVSLLSK
jgi:DNA-binding response OmpR family regulator